MSIRRDAKLSLRAFAKEMRADFPDVSPAFVSAAERSETTGVKFTNQFENAARKRFGRVKRPENRKKPNRITVWLTDDQMRFIEWALTRYGATSKSDLLGIFIDTEMRFSRYKKAAPCADTQETTSQITTAQL